MQRFRIKAFCEGLWGLGPLGLDGLRLGDSGLRFGGCRVYGLGVKRVRLSRTCARRKENGNYGMQYVSSYIGSSSVVIRSTYQTHGVWKTLNLVPQTIKLRPKQPTPFEQTSKHGSTLGRRSMHGAATQGLSFELWRVQV